MTERGAIFSISHRLVISSRWRFFQSGSNSGTFSGNRENEVKPKNYGGYNGASKGAEVPLIYAHSGDTRHEVGEKKVGATLYYELVHEYFQLIVGKKFRVEVGIKYRYWMSHRIHLKDLDVIASGNKPNDEVSKSLVELPEPPK